MNMFKRIICVLLLALCLLSLATGCGKKVELGIQNCIKCGKEYAPDPDKTYIDADGEAIFICPDCSK